MDKISPLRQTKDTKSGVETPLSSLAIFPESLYILAHEKNLEPSTSTWHR